MKSGSSKKTARVKGKVRRSAKEKASTPIVLRKILQTLTDSCPVEHGNPEHCPLRNVRKLPSVKRTSWLLAIPGEDVRSLTAYHYMCAKTHRDR
jgi:hypothetical protein